MHVVVEVLFVVAISVIGIAFQAFMLRFASSFTPKTIDWGPAALTVVIGSVIAFALEVGASWAQVSPLLAGIVGLLAWTVVVALVNAAPPGRALVIALLMAFMSWLLAFMLLAALILANPSGAIL